jgi:hypothetical protein
LAAVKMMKGQKRVTYVLLNEFDAAWSLEIIGQQKINNGIS